MSEICPVGRKYSPTHATCRTCAVKCSERMTGRIEQQRLKYGNHKVVVDGVKFDSKKEAARYQVLKMMEKAGEVSGIILQEKFELIPKQKGERSVSYAADFSYTKNGEKIIEDVKSKITKTRTYIIKRKLMLFIHNIRIREV